MPVTLYMDTWVEAICRDLGLDSVDEKYVVRRVKSEGFTFLSVTMPKLIKCVLRGLEVGDFRKVIRCPQDPFTHIAWKGGSLRFFRSLLCRIFDQVGHPIMGADAAQALKSLRQLGEYFYKLAVAYTDEQLVSAERKYYEHEEQLVIRERELSREWVTRLKRNFETYYPELARATVHGIFDSFRPRDTKGSFYGSHKTEDVCGVPAPVWKQLPATYSRWSAEQSAPSVKNGRYSFLRVKGDCNREQAAYSGFFNPDVHYVRQHPIFHKKDWHLPMTFMREFAGWLWGLGPGIVPHPDRIFKRPVIVVNEPSVVEVLFVPKDSRGPRTISKECYHRLRGQMSYFDFMSQGLESCTQGAVNFRDQEVNQRLAEESSVTRSHVTADLKDASDSVLFRLISEIFSDSPGLRWFVRYNRAQYAILPSRRKIPLSKLAGMGSGLTFPTMALLIHLSVCTSVSKIHGVPFHKVMPQIKVYGDDLIVPVEYWAAAQIGLENSKLEINLQKTFKDSYFRESCGADYYCGFNVVPVRCKLSHGDPEISTVQSKLDGKKVYVTANGKVSIDESAGLVQLERHCRELIIHGMARTADYLYKRLEEDARIGRLPFVSGESPALGRYSTVPRHNLGIYAWNDDLQEVAIPARVPKDVRIGFETCPEKHLQKVLRGKFVFDYTNLLTPDPRPEYGEISLPYTCEIESRLVSPHVLDGIIPAV